MPAAHSQMLQHRAVTSFLRRGSGGLEFECRESVNLGAAPSGVIACGKIMRLERDLTLDNLA